MRRTVLNAVALLAAVALVIGCDSGKGTVPSKLDQPIPTVAPTAGGEKVGGATAKNKNVPPNTKVD
jgi:hypothetical protein